MFKWFRVWKLKWFKVDTFFYHLLTLKANILGNLWIIETWFEFWILKNQKIGILIFWKLEWWFGKLKIELMVSKSMEPFDWMFSDGSIWMVLWFCSVQFKFCFFSNSLVLNGLSLRLPKQTNTRPNLAYVVHLLAKFTTSLKRRHFQAMVLLDT